MTTLQEACHKALEALESMLTVETQFDASVAESCARAAIDSIKAALAQQGEQPQHERVYETIIQWDEGGGKRSRRELTRRIEALYAAAPAPQGGAK